MAKTIIINEGEMIRQQAFAIIPCPVDGEPTRHAQQRVIAHWPSHWKAKWHVLVRCSKCKLEHVWYTNELPDGLQLYQVRIHAQGRVIPEFNQEVPTLEEAFQMLATDRQAAYQQSQFSRTMQTSGQLVEVYVDGEIERDERY